MTLSKLAKITLGNAAFKDAAVYLEDFMVEDMPESPSGQYSVNLVGHFGACDRNLAEYMLGRAGFIAAVGDDFFQKRVHERGDSQYAVFVAEDIFMRTSRMKFHLVVPVSMPENSFGYSG